MKQILLIPALVTFLLTIISCNENSSVGASNYVFPPEEIGYEVFEVVGSPMKNHNVVSMQGYPSGGILNIRFNDYEFQGDLNREYMVLKYNDDSHEVTGYIVYVKTIIDN